MGFLTGKPASSTSNSTSYNTTQPYIQSEFDDLVSTGSQANSKLYSLLGIGGDGEAAKNAFSSYLNSSGYNRALTDLTRGVTGNAAAGGLLRSGSTAKALQSNAANLGQNYFNNYLQQLGVLTGQGLQAGGLIGGTGGYSNSTGANSGGTQGLLGTIGQLGQAAGGFAMLSDRRAKTDIKKVSQFEDGLGIYDFKYKGSEVVQRGVMADEVAKLRPWALGPEVNGMSTVIYGAL